MLPSESVAKSMHHTSLSMGV